MFEENFAKLQAVLNGEYGRISEILAIFFIVMIFNFVTKKILRHLHVRFKTQNKVWKDSFVRALYLPLSYFVWVFAFVYSLELVLEMFFSYENLPYKNLVVEFALIFCFTWFLLRWKTNLSEYLLLKSRTREIALEPSKVDVISKAATILIIFVCIILVLDVTDSSFNTLIAFGGVGGLAVAFASQEMIANFFGGLTIYINQPFTIGEWVYLPEKNIEGIVEQIGWYTTRVRNFEKKPVYVPNSIFTKMVVITPGRMTHRQFKTKVGIRYQDFNVVDQIVQDIRSLLVHHPDIDLQFKPNIFLESFGPSSINIQVDGYSAITDGYEFNLLQADLLKKIYEIVLKNGAEMPFPVTQVELKNEEAFKIAKIQI